MTPRPVITECEKQVFKLSRPNGVDTQNGRSGPIEIFVAARNQSEACELLRFWSIDDVAKSELKLLSRAPSNQETRRLTLHFGVAWRRPKSTGLLSASDSFIPNF